MRRLYDLGCIYSGQILSYTKMLGQLQGAGNTATIVMNSALLSSRMEETFSQIINKPGIWGRLVESSIEAHLLNNSVRGKYLLYYWRQGNDEIGFVIKKNENTIGFEIKSGHSLKRSGMETFRKIFNPPKIILVGEKGLSWQEFPGINPGELF
jgi:predicted AAA+ superfamily ATPase